MPIQNAGLPLFVLGTCIVIFDSLSVKIPTCIKRRYPAVWHISGNSVYSKEHICTHEHCSCNLKYINTMMNLKLLFIMVVFEHWLSLCTCIAENQSTGRLTVFSDGCLTGWKYCFLFKILDLNSDRSSCVIWYCMLSFAVPGDGIEFVFLN